MALCSCIKGSGNFKFDLESLDCKTLLYQDLSNWMEEDHYEVPEEYEVKVSIPAQKHEAVVKVKTGIKNPLKSKQLQGVENLCLPDGVYCFTLESCGKKYQSHKGVSCRLQCCVDQAVSQATREEEWLIITDIRNWIDSFHSNADQGKYKHAQQSYTVAEKLLKRLNCPCTGVCCH